MSISSADSRDDDGGSSNNNTDANKTANNTNNNSNKAIIIQDLRERGNYEFSQCRYEHALTLYNMAIDEACSNQSNDDSETILNLLCNRSTCYYIMEDFGKSKHDAKLAWELSLYTNTKAAYRYAKACYACHEYKQAKDIIQHALKNLNDHELVHELATTTTADGRGAKKKTSGANKKKQQQRPAVPDRRLKKKDDNDERQQQQQETDDDKDDDLKKQVSEESSQTTSATNSVAIMTLDNPSSSQERHAIQELYKQVEQAIANQQQDDEPEEISSIKCVQRPISIKEFILPKSDDSDAGLLGHGNFSEILAVTHKSTREPFALKRIAKAKAADLFKRQHPNVYNEIQMERRILLERLKDTNHAASNHYIIQMYHAFQDYNHLYYLMELHVVNGDLWNKLRYKNLPGYGPTKPRPYEKLVMMGCHRSTCKLWLYEILHALEFLHSRGIVHRDLKAENILLDNKNHIVLIDFGTAKDLIQTDLNGPEFVGTPDFMSPEAVAGKEVPSSESGLEAGPEADLWALGALCFILQTGHTPYWSPSPYLAFLKTKRALKSFNLRRPIGIIDDECWDFITQLMQGIASQRLGAGIFTVVEEGDDNDGARKRRHMERRNPKGYDVIREHPYFADVHSESTTTDGSSKSKSLPIPSLSDLCIRAVAEMAYRDSQDLNLCDAHPPGDGSRHDLLRLKRRERHAVMHCLDRRLLLSEPRLYARFFPNVVQARLDKIRPGTHSVVGLTQMNDNQGKPPQAKMHDQYATPAIETGPIEIVHISSPLLCQDMDDADETKRKHRTKLLKKCVAQINRTRPHLVVAAGRNCSILKKKSTSDDDADDNTAAAKAPSSVGKILARISETIPVVVNDGTEYFTFWMMGVQCIALRSRDNDEDDLEQSRWLSEQLEQVRMSKHPLYVFYDSNPGHLSQKVLKKLARGRALCLFGTMQNDTQDDGGILESTIKYQANETLDDNSSIRSNEDSDDEGDDANFSMKVRATCRNGLRRIITTDEPDVWHETFEPVDLPPTTGS